MTIKINNINKRFKDYQVLNDINFTIKKGELIALLGPSGSGKTTLLRIIAGLELPDSGQIVVNNINTANKSIKERAIGFVFQHYALFNHMSIFDNIAFGLKIKPKKERLSNKQIQDKVNNLIKMVHIERISHFYPSQISGGQKQRVALARALAVEPEILLLDEPFGALDSKVRKELRKWIRKLHKEINLTSIFVTHDQEEAMEIADRIIIMNNGKIEQIGTAYEVYHNPKNSFIYDFLGNFNIFDKNYDKDNSELDNHLKLDDNVKKQPSRINKNILTKFFSLFSFRKKAEKIENKLLASSNIKIFSRPYDMDVIKLTDDKKYIKTTLAHINPAGAVVKLELEKDNGDVIYAEISHLYFSELKPAVGDKLYTYPRKAKIFEDENR